MGENPNWLSYFSEGWLNHQPDNVVWFVCLKCWNEMEPTVNHIWPCFAKQTGQNAALEVLHDFAPDTLLAKSHTGAKMCQTLRAKDWLCFSPWGLLIRFYQGCSSCSPLPRLAVLLLVLLFLASSSSASSSSFSSTMSASTSTSTSALPTLRQALCQLSSPSSLPTSQLSVHRRTSTWDLPSSVRAGPQPGTFPAQCALLDLNLGPSQLSVHRWTSTWDLPSSVCTAGPQPGTFPAQCAPLDLKLGHAQLSLHRWTWTAR